MNPGTTSATPPKSDLIAVLLSIASIAVLLATSLASFRRGFADDLATDWLVNGPRVLFAAAVGAALALSGGLRLTRGREGALREVEILAAAAGGAAGGWALCRHASGVGATVWFALGALIAAAAMVALVRCLDRPRRWTNLALAGVLVGLGIATAFAGTYGRERSDWSAAAIAWLLGDLSGTSFASAALLLVATAILAIAALRRLDTQASLDAVALAAFALATGATGPLAFVGTLAPRTVRWLAAGASAPALLLTGMAAGAATVAAVDAVPRLLLGGYDFPWNLPATMLAIPIFLGWNRMRLRHELGPAHIAFEILEIALIVGLTIAAVALAVVLTGVIRAAT